MNGNKCSASLTKCVLFACLLIDAAKAFATIGIWDGFYLGTQAGVVFAHFDTHTSLSANSLLNGAQTAAINQVGNQQIDTTGFIGGMDAGYNWQSNQFLFGIGIDVQSLSSNGETNSGAIPDLNNDNNQFVITSYANNNWLLTARPRLGLVTDHGLFYVTGGLGVTFLQSDFVFSDALGAVESKRLSQAKAGYVVGTGLEAKLTEEVSVKAEYLFTDFSETTAHRMSPIHNVSESQIFSNQVSLEDHLLTLGLHYNFDHKGSHSWHMPEFFNVHNWESSVGARLFVSSGMDGSPQPLFNTSDAGNRLASRLTFSDLTAISEETFARFDHVSGFFIKGNLGAGSVTSGRLNDEDFPAIEAYSNTLSNALGDLSYATVDVGYSFFKTPSAKVGAFIGYNYYAQNLNVYNCQQLAGDVVCDDPGELSHFLGISEDDALNSLRIGLSSQVYLLNQLMLTSEVAYIPATMFRGLDIHNARQLLGPEQADYGDGAMLETLLDYQITPSWHVGVGGRYWMWNMHSGSVIFDFLGDSELLSEPAHFNAARYGGFVQLNYRHESIEHPDVDSYVPNWRGLFIGGQLGGAWGKSRWSHPFGSTAAEAGYMNIAGFGDHIQARGPLGGGSFNINWQSGRLIYGVGSSISATDIRGENTLFSGIGGINGQAITTYLATIVGRIGTTWNRSFIYANAGSAVLNTQYTLNGNTGVLTLGKQEQTNHTWGFTVGAGIEFALNSRWSSSLEYDYIGIPDETIPFSSIDLINAYRITASQAISIFKLGVNYKIDIAAK